MVPNCYVENLNLLQKIETILGSIEEWPTNIIRLIFTGDFTSLNMFLITNFFCGNKVPLDVVHPFFTKCSGLDRFLTLRHFNVIYARNDYRLNSNCVCEVCAYYNIEHKRLLWIDRENPDFEQREVPLGIEGTGFSNFIRNKLQLLFG